MDDSTFHPVICSHTKMLVIHDPQATHPWQLVPCIDPRTAVGLGVNVVSNPCEDTSGHHTLDSYSRIWRSVVRGDDRSNGCVVPKSSVPGWNWPCGVL